MALAGCPRAGEVPVYLNRFWQTSEGMPSNAVSDVAKDRDGFLWIATGAGVARFDGLRFDVFYAKDGLPDTRIFCLYVDRKNRVWVGTRRGVAYRENGVWIVPPGFSNEAVYALGEGDDGSIWIGSYQGCWRWTADRSERIELGGTIADVRSFLSAGPAGMWVLTSSRLLVWKADHPHAVEECPGPWIGKDLHDLARDHDGRMILCGTGILLRQRENGWEDLDQSISGGDRDANLACAVAPDDTLWVATRNRGLVFIRGEETGIIDATKNLSLNDVRSVMIDDDGMIMAGTNGGGINILRRRFFDTYSTDEGLGSTITSALVINRDGALLAGTDGSGIFIKRDGRFMPHFRNTGLPANGLIWSLCARSDNSVWIGTYGDGMFRVHNNLAERIVLPANISNHSISALNETRDGGILIGTHSAGVRKWKDGQVDPSFVPLTPGDQCVVYDMLEDRQDRIWIATGNSGLWMLENGVWQEMTRTLGMPGLLATVLHESPNGDLWIGSLGQGLARCRDNHLATWSLRDGIVSDTICQILEDDTGHLWLGSDRGLQRVSAATLEAYHPGGNRLPVESMRFSREDGLPTPQFSAEHGNLAVRAKDGSLWFSLASGVIRVDPRRFSKSTALPFTRIESAVADQGQIWTFDGPQARDPIVLHPGAGTLQIRFTSPNFIAPERGRFQYRMTGVENEWQEVAGARVASYASLPPGTYQFEVMGATVDGTWNPQPTRVNVVVEPYLWQTRGFRVLLSLAALTTVGLLIWTWSLRRIRRRMTLIMQEHRIEKERTRIARDLHDDLGASLTEINFLGTLTANAVTDRAVRSRIEGMVERAQRMTKSLDEIVWTVNPANDTLSSTANYLCSRAQESLVTAGIRCRLEVADDLPLTPLDSELRHHLLMAVNEAVHNVLKHSGATVCTMTIRIERGGLFLSIADDGTGFVPVSKPDTRNGLLNLQRRMEASGGSVDIASTPQGTTVTLRIPLP
ncbi:MAG: triple tyrosine motif-containing protein [Verrucomicrobia bacterium]|nr:triple tyrosine motif-containing protein [Verrucomicrobiota bacterium]